MYLYVEYCMHIDAGGVVDIVNDRNNHSNNIALKKGKSDLITHTHTHSEVV
jgi:hypothetical protein